MRELLDASPGLLNASDSVGGTPLITAAYGDNAAIARLLVSRKADLNAKKEDGWTPLKFAQWKKRPEIEALLRQHGVTE